jgi:hypothetical protein
MKTNVNLSQESEDVLDDFAKMKRPERLKKEALVNEALVTLGKFIKYLDSETLLNVADLKATN